MTTSILNIFSTSNLAKKEITNTIDELFPSLSQGTQYNQYQSTIEQSLEKQAEILSGKEGFQLSTSTNRLIGEYVNTSTDVSVNELQLEYNRTLQEYNTLVNTINRSVNNYVDRTSANNPYKNKHIRFTDGTICYVTSRGVAKPYASSADFTATAGKNGCPSSTTMAVNIAWNARNTVGTVLATTPPLTVGTPMRPGQPCGGEGVNYFVNQMVSQNTLTPSYMGCYKSNNNFTFIGKRPPAADIYIQNGYFSQPVLTEDSYKYITGSTVPGWHFANSALARASKEWGFPMPYPNGPQCAVIDRTSSIYTTIDLTAGITYTLTLYACGRNNRNNPVLVQLYTNVDAFISQIGRVVPANNSWRQKTITFSAPTSQRYRLYFKGESARNNSTALQAIILSHTANTQGEYKFNQCKNAAEISGYQYFGIQEANATTGKGFCAVSNNEPAFTKLGKASVPSQMVELWSSNTGGQPGNIAMISTTGSIQVINSSGVVVYSSPSPAGANANYIGCYTDKTPNAMTSASVSGNVSANQCKTFATNGNYSYYATQNTTSDKTANCMVSNTLAEATKYGLASNCSKVRNVWMGGAQSNAIYSIKPESVYYLAVQNDGNLVVYRGSSPQDNQGVIWSARTTGKQIDANPRMTALRGKYGQNWIISGSTLVAGDFVGSNNGKVALVMRNDGNLVLYAYRMVENCQQVGQYTVGGQDSVAVYNNGTKGNRAHMGKLAYVDEDAKLYNYPSSNQSFSTNYQIIPNADMSGNDIIDASFGSGGFTVKTCKQWCDRRQDCAGIVFDNRTQQCYPKTSKIYPYGNSLTSSLNKDLYLRSKRPAKPPTGVTRDVININTLQYQQYVDNGAVDGSVRSRYGLASATSVEKQQLSQLQTKMGLLAKQITELTSTFQSGAMKAEQQSKQNIAGVRQYRQTISSANTQFDDMAKNKGEIQNIVSDSDIVVLQKNYEYLAWSILAAGAVLVSMNVIKNKVA
ncbi:MAG: hypothetical protein ACOVRN_00640 [Flavobacterium sp.]